MHAPTDEITASEADKFAAKAENDAVLYDLKAKIIRLAYEADLWGINDELGVHPEMMLRRLESMLEEARTRRAEIRMKYKVSLL